MSEFSVEISPHAVRDLRGIAPSLRLDLLHAIKQLHVAPFPAGNRIRRIRGAKRPLYRLRIRDYRVVYRIEDSKIIVLSVVHRRELERCLKDLL